MLSILDFMVRKKVEEDKTEDLFRENTSEVSDNASNLMVSTINFVKDEHNKKHTLMPAI